MIVPTYMVKGYSEDGHDFLLHFSFTKKDADAWADVFKRELGAVRTEITMFDSKQD